MKRPSTISSLILLLRALLTTSVRSQAEEMPGLEFGSVYCPSMSDAISTCKPGSQFYHYYCCGDMGFYCCFAFKTWFVVVLSCAGFMASVCLGYLIMKFVCCRSKSLLIFYHWLVLDML
uniref:Protein shisa-5 n=1 Tax=Ascaris lumbricoides TaxID=6252 RepID=A0A0M3HTR0_ASCLU